MQTQNLQDSENVFVSQKISYFLFRYLNIAKILTLYNVVFSFRFRGLIFIRLVVFNTNLIISITKLSLTALTIIILTIIHRAAELYLKNHITNKRDWCLLKIHSFSLQPIWTHDIILC